MKQKTQHKHVRFNEMGKQDQSPKHKHIKFEEIWY